MTVPPVAPTMAVLRAVTLNLLKQNISKSSLRQKRFRAAMDTGFLLHLLKFEAITLASIALLLPRIEDYARIIMLYYVYTI